MKFFIIFLLTLSLSLADLISPENNADLRTVHILFEWEQEPAAVGYNLQILDLSNNILLDIELEHTVYIEKNIINWDASYYWRVRAIYSEGTSENWIGTRIFDIGDSILTNLNMSYYDNSFLEDEELIIYSQFSPYFAVGAIDMQGNEIWNTQVAYMNHVTKFGEIYGLLDDKGVKYNFNQEILWQSPNGFNIDSHEVKDIPNGNYMAFAYTVQNGPIPSGAWTPLFQSQGYQADGITNEFPWVGLKIVEFDKESNDLVWSWDPFTHFSMTDSDLYEGTWWGAAFNGMFDWMHSNAFHFDNEESVIYVSHRHLSRISKISYPSGDVIWNMGLPEEYNTGSDNICTDLLFSFQHHIQLLDDGDLLFFDNGNLSDMLSDDDSPITRIRRIRVIDDSYCETVWQYDLLPNLHGLGMGSVQLLDNGNYSIYTFGSGLNEGECSIIEINQEGDMLWKATSSNEDAAWYRSYKIPSIYPDAFSVIADNYTTSDNSNNIQLNGNSLIFSINNKSGYSQTYKYLFSDLIDGGASMFSNIEEEIILGPYENIDISIPVANQSVTETMIGFSIWPTHHDYAIKELIFEVLNSNSLLGDINNDGMINVLDIVVLVNIILEQSSLESADVNYDGNVNVLDVVYLINIILNN